MLAEGHKRVGDCIKKEKKQFWYKIDGDTSPQEKLAILIRMAANGTPRYGQLIKNRAKFDDLKYKSYPMAGKLCIVCESPAQARHHIRPLMFGGGNSTYNIVYLCRGCHAEIHPWLKGNTSTID